MDKHMFKASAPLLALIFVATPLQAETLLLDAIAAEPPNNSAGLLRPSPGTDMQKVEARFGKPESTYGPVGEPPISRWTYPDYSVYFEFDKVLTSVVHR
jgi:hypothetical protein